MMRLCAWVFIGLLSTAPGLLFAGEQEDRLLQSLRERAPTLKVESVRKVPASDFYEIVSKGRNILYTDVAGNLVLSGNLFDLETKTNLTNARREELNFVDFSRLPLDRAIVKVKGSGARKLAIFSDPDCPYCKRLELELANVTDVTLYLFLFPIEALHPDAPRKARAVWCATDQVRAWDELMQASKEPEVPLSSCKDTLEQVAKVADEMSITGTPALIFQSGRLVPGAIGADQIETLLEASDKQPSTSSSGASARQQ